MPTDGLGSDAGRQSLTAVGAGGARARRADACRACGAYFAAGDLRCPSCGAARQGTRRSRQRAAAQLSPLSGGGDDASTEAAANRPGPGTAASDAGAPGSGHVSAARLSALPWASPTTFDRAPTLPHPPGRGRRGERFVAWSALVVLAVAAVFFVQRIGDMRDEQIRAEAARSVASKTDRRPRAVGAPTIVAAAVGDAARDAGMPSAPANAEPTAEPKASSTRARRPPPTPISAVRKPPRAAAPRAPSPAPATVADAQHAVPVAEPSRWDRMREEIALCGTDGFFARMICELDVRTRYCSGWWGSADECPSGRTADYGN